MQVSEVMHKGVFTAQMNDSIRKVAYLMKREDIGAVPVYKNERPVGFVTDRDIVISCVAQGHNSEEPISHAMSKHIVSILENADIRHAAKLMKDKQISRLLVIDAGETPVGILTLRDVARNMPDQILTADVLSNIKR